MPLASPNRPLWSLCRQCRSRVIRNFSQASRTASSSSSPIALQNKSDEVSHIVEEQQPRWKRTPRAMVAPVRARPTNSNDEYPVNEDPAKLDEMYRTILGKDGPNMLPEEVKWLAVTHKSFDHGRRGFNDRLAFLGKRIVELQTSLTLLRAPASQASHLSAGSVDKFGREHFTSPSTIGIDNVGPEEKASFGDKGRMARLAREYGLDKVIRWKPRRIRDMKASGIDVVLAHTMYAIVGALALQRGGEVANTFTRQKILSKLGL